MHGRNPDRCRRWAGVPLPGGPAIVMAAAIGLFAVLSKEPDPSSSRAIVLNRHSCGIRALAPAPDGARTAWIGWDGTLGLTDWSCGPIATTVFRSHEASRPLAVAFSPDGLSLAIGFESGVLEILGTSAWQTHLRLNTRGEAVKCVAYSQDGLVIATGTSDSMIRLWEARSGRLLVTLCGHRADVSGLAFDSSGRELASSDIRGQVLIWNWCESRKLDSMEPIGCIPGDTTALAFSQRGDWLAFSRLTQPVVFFNRRTRRIEEVRRVPGGTSAAIAVSPSFDSLVSGRRTGAIDVRNLREEIRPLTREGHEGIVSAVAYLANDRIVSAGVDGTLRLWNLPR